MLTSEESKEIARCITIASAARARDDVAQIPTHVLLEAVRRETAVADPCIDRLTRREREVFELLARGVRNREIGTRLCIGSKTVDTHRTRIMSKMGLSGNSHLVLWAVRHGIL